MLEKSIQLLPFWIFCSIFKSHEVDYFARIVSNEREFLENFPSSIYKWTSLTLLYNIFSALHQLYYLYLRWYLTSFLYRIIQTNTETTHAHILCCDFSVVYHRVLFCIVVCTLLWFNAADSKILISEFLDSNIYNGIHHRPWLCIWWHDVMM